jgi:hypothetical protein
MKKYFDIKRFSNKSIFYKNLFLKILIIYIKTDFEICIIANFGEIDLEKIRIFIVKNKNKK